MIHFDEGKYVSDPGSPFRPVYSAKVEADGEVVLTQVGEENINDLIQACKDSTDISTIVAYYNQTGDATVLQRYVPNYGDFSKLPKSLAEFLQLRIDSENFFYALPVEVRKEFDNDSNKFFAQAGDESWYKKLQPVVNPGQDPDPNSDSKVGDSGDAA